MTDTLSQSTGISTEEYRQRVERIQAAMQEGGYRALILWCDATRCSNVRYVVDFTPVLGYTDIAIALVLLPAEGEPALFVSQMSVQWGEEVSWFQTRPFGEMLGELLKLRDSMEPPGSWMGPTGKIGVAGLSYIPMNVYETLKGVFGMSAIQLTPAEPILAPIKAKKSSHEIELLRRAGEVTVAGLDAVKTAVAAGGKTEREVARMVSAAMFEAGDGPAFKPQIQCGPDHSNCNIMAATDRVIEPGNSLLVDFGGVYRGYVTDIARGATIGAVDPKQADIIKVAAEALDETCDKLRPGMTAGEVSAITEDALIRAGYEDYSDEARGYGTGHGIGTDIEEEEPWIARGSEFVLEESMAVSLKASIFVPGLAGVRIEDNLVVTSSGADVYTPYPRVLTW